MGVKEGNQLATAQDELVNGKLRLVRNILRMNDHQHLHVVLNVLRAHLDALNVEVLLQLINQRPGGHALLAHLHHHGVGRRPAKNGQGTHDAERWFFGREHPRNGPGQIILQLPFAVGLEKRNGDPFIGKADRETEVVAIAAGQLLGFESIQACGILGVRVRLWIVFFDDEIFPGNLFVFLEQVFDFARVAFQEDGFRRGRFALRAIEPDLYRRIEFLEHGLGAGGQGVGFFLGEIHARRGHAQEDVDRDQEDEHHQDARSGIKDGFE